MRAAENVRLLADGHVSLASGRETRRALLKALFAA